jgi:hypothetical protein
MLTLRKHLRWVLSVAALSGAAVFAVPDSASGQICDRCSEMVVYHGSSATYYHSFEPADWGVWRTCGGQEDTEDATG